MIKLAVAAVVKRNQKVQESSSVYTPFFPEFVMYNFQTNHPMNIPGFIR